MSQLVDLSALEPDGARTELLVSGIMRRATTELARRAAADVSPIAVLYQLSRPALAAAAVLAAICLPVLASHRFDRMPAPGGGLADALEVPAPVNEWLVENRSPTVADLLIALEE
ncbi:MAG: hypothetical protein WEF86_05625 [Gemmatimonadota bacterium]